MKLKIGITINLENYENLRLDIEEELGGERGVTLSDLIAAFADIMQAFGRNDEHAKAAIDAYCSRILGIGKQVGEEKTKIWFAGPLPGVVGPSPPCGEEKPAAQEKTPSSQPEGTAKPEAAQKPPSPPVEQPAPATAKEPEKPSVHADAKVFQGTLSGKAVPSGGKCADCGAEDVPKAVADASKTFTGRVLCRLCLDKESERAEKKRQEKKP